MKLTIESTTKIVELNGVPARVWEGHTETGIAVHCFITRVAVHNDLNHAEFEKELADQRPPSPDVEAYPLRMIL